MVLQVSDSPSLCGCNHFDYTIKARHTHAHAHRHTHIRQPLPAKEKASGKGGFLSHLRAGSTSAALLCWHQGICWVVAGHQELCICVVDAGSVDCFISSSLAWNSIASVGPPHQAHAICLGSLPSFLAGGMSATVWGLDFTLDLRGAAAA